jgi:hypothetical protein
MCGNFENERVFAPGGLHVEYAGYFFEGDWRSNDQLHIPFARIGLRAN